MSYFKEFFFFFPAYTGQNLADENLYNSAQITEEWNASIDRLYPECFALFLY